MGVFSGGCIFFLFAMLVKYKVIQGSFPKCYSDEAEQPIEATLKLPPPLPPWPPCPSRVAGAWALTQFPGAAGPGRLDSRESSLVGGPTHSAQLPRQRAGAGLWLRASPEAPARNLGPCPVSSGVAVSPAVTS